MAGACYIKESKEVGRSIFYIFFVGNFTLIQLILKIDPVSQILEDFLSLSLQEAWFRICDELVSGRTEELLPIYLVG